jgi:hypothetical protein
MGERFARIKAMAEEKWDGITFEMPPDEFTQLVDGLMQQAILDQFALSPEMVTDPQGHSTMGTNYASMTAAIHQYDDLWRTGPDASR